MPDMDTTLHMLIAAGLVRVGMDKKSLAVRLHISEPTLYRRIANPGTLTVAELRKLATILKIDKYELLKAIC